MKPISESIYDAKGNIHHLTQQIGTDGQGALYLTSNGGVILRMSPERESDCQRYDDAKLLPLSHIDNICMPIEYLQKPHIGYLITLPEDFVPLRTLVDVTKGQTPTDFYTRSGGTKWRLHLLADLAKTLHNLHALPVMYGSMSLDRVFIPPKTINPTIRLLYSVKMDCSMTFQEEHDEDPYTAPESGQGQTSLLSDSYAFSALAYDVLTLSKELEKVITPEFKAIFTQAAEPTPTLRPKMINFYRAFLQQLDMLVTCKKCRLDFLYAPACPFCQDSPPKVLKAVIYDQVEQTRIDRGLKVFEFAIMQHFFWNYHTDNILLHDSIEKSIESAISISADKKLTLMLKNLMDKDIFVNDIHLEPGQETNIALPCERILVSFKLYSSVTRYIDMVIA